MFIYLFMMWRKDNCWKEEAMRMLSERPFPHGDEWSWNLVEKRRAWRCVKFDIPYIRCPWRKKGVGFRPELTPENQEAIAEMIAKNPLFKEEIWKEKLEDWLHPETKEERRRAREKERQRRLAQEREDIEAMRLRMAGVHHGRPRAKGSDEGTCSRSMDRTY
jgi:hypothetical protein